MSDLRPLEPGPMTELAGPFDEALVDGRLVLQRCNECKTVIMYPKYRCPTCFGADLGWVDSPGNGVLHSFTVLRIGSPTGYEADLPYAVCVVKLDEGVQLLGRLHPGQDSTWDHYRCDQPVRFRANYPSRPAVRPTPWFDTA